MRLVSSSIHMNSSTFIDQAIRCGTAHGMDALGPVEAIVFAVSEAEVYYDMEGVDSLLDRYGLDGMDLFAKAFSAIGASDIAAAFHAIAVSARPAGQELLPLANGLVVARKGYSYASIESFVERSAW